MAVNMYDEAAPVRYVSQYVPNPIPFQELVALGKYYGDEIKAARKELNDYAKSVGEFQSLLTKDVDSYHRIALNDNIRRIIDEAVANPSVMKSAAWRSSMAGALNSVNYADLSKLKKSAEQADLYDKLYKSLAAQGKMPPGWEKDWYSTYDTLGEQKIFDKTPLAYQSVDDLAWEYVKDLPDTFLYNKNGYNWYGVSEETALKQIGDNSHELLSHPIIQRHIEMLKASGMNEDEAVTNVINRAKLTALRKAHKKPELDQYAYLNTKARLDAESGSGKNINGVNTDRIQQIQAGALKRNMDYMQYLSNSLFGKSINELTEEETAQIGIAMKNSAKDPMLKKQLAVQLDWGEYLNYQDPSGSIRTSITDKDGNTKKGEDNLEEYMFRNTDVVFTTDGQELGDIPISYINGRQDENRTINIKNILQFITDSAFKGNGTANLHNDSRNDSYDGNYNYMIANGKLIVPEEVLEAAIEAAYPEEAGDILDMFMDGVKDPRTGRRVHQIATKHKGKNSYLYGHDDLYEINIGRAFGNDAATNARFNEDRMNDVMGASTVAKNQQNVIGSSWQEAGITEFD